MQVTHCPVCGFGPFEVPYPSVRHLMSSHDICDCCFCQYGYDDTGAYRKDWIDQGCPWHGKTKPESWDRDAQLANAIEGWLGFMSGHARSPDYETTYGPQIDRYLGWVGDPDPRRRLSAVLVLGGLGDERVEQALRRSADDEDEDVRYFSEEAVRSRGADGGHETR